MRKRRVCVELIVCKENETWHKDYQFVETFYPEDPTVGQDALLKFSEGIEGPAQGSPTTRGVDLGPEQVDQGIAPVALARDGQVRQKAGSLAPAQLDWHAMALDTGRAEQIQSKVGHQNTSLMISVLETRRKVNRRL